MMNEMIIDNYYGVLDIANNASERCIILLQMQEFRTGVTRQSMETEHAKEETKRLRLQLTDLRDKLSDLESKVCN